MANEVKLNPDGFAFLNDCYEVVLPEIHIGEWVGYNWPVLTCLSLPFKFLLGTDSMRFFNWHFDYENGVCRFDLIPGKRKLLFNQKEQSIHAIDEAEQGKVSIYAINSIRCINSYIC